MDIDIAELGEDFLFAVVPRVEPAEPFAQFGVSVLGQIDIPRALIVAEEREDGRGQFDTRFQRRAGQGKSPTLAAAGVDLPEDVLRACDEVSREILYPMG